MARPLSYAYARNNCVLVTDVVDGNIQLHCCLATPPSAIAELQRVLSAPIKLVMQEEASLREQINDTFQRQQGDAMSEIGDISNEVDLDRLVDEIPESQDLLDAQDDAPVIRLINALFGEALKRDASDIHIETYEKTMSVRLRVDGILQEVLTPSRRLAPLLVSRIKVMSRLDIAEKRVPQDGRVSLRIAGRSVDIRVSTIPSNYGERVVMRLLDKQAARIDLGHLGLRDETLSRMKDVLAQPNGIFLVTGPTGSGKSTTLYAALMALNDRRRNILTVEDPIEYDIEGIGQTQVHSKVGMSFARGLRAILRQDPDVVMVGEIRDQETAEMAVQASLTGHLVLSTLHTNTAIGAVTRLVDIGVEPYLIASSLKGVMAQRLVRKLCQHCRVEITMDKAEARLLGDLALEGQRAYSAGSCEHCRNTGYKGRQGVYELLIIDREISDMIHNRAGEQDIMRYLGTRSNSLMAEGRRMVCAGQTSIDELLRSVREDSDASL